jgi:hypothetical protein
VGTFAALTKTQKERSEPIPAREIRKYEEDFAYCRSKNAVEKRAHAEWT